MAVVSCAQIGPGRGGENRQDFNRSYTVPFLVIVDDGRDGMYATSNAVDPNTGVAIPPRYSRYIGYENGGDDIFALCVSAVPKQDGKSWARWIVECTFTTDFQIQNNEDPSDDFVLPWLEIEKERRKVTKEWDGTPIVNSAGELMDGLEDDFSVYVICYQRNELQINPLLAQYNDAINSDTFTPAIGPTMMPGQGKMSIMVDKPQRRTQYFFWPHTYKIKYNPGPTGWDVDPADAGAHVLSTGNPQKLIDYVDPVRNVIVGYPIWLNGSGQRLADGSPIQYLSQAKTGTGNDGSYKALKQHLPFKALGLNNLNGSNGLG